MLPWLLCAAACAAILGLCIKIKVLHQSMDEIRTELGERLCQETNTLLTLSSRDRHARRLASELNRELRKLREERRRFQRGDLELKAAVTNLSHDLRTPLTAICGYLDLLEREEKTETAQRYLRTISNRVELMKQLTEELFRYSVVLSKKETGLQGTPTALNRALEESVAAYYAALKERGITPEIRMPEGKVTCLADPSALSRVFSNLLSNALKYSDGDLSIILHETGEVVFSNTASRLNAVQVGKLFDRFYTVEEGRSATGLGLSIARTLVEQMGGTIAADYRDGRLNVRLRLPGAG